MTIKTELTFGDILRLSSGAARVVLQNISDAGRGRAYMDYTKWCWDGAVTPKIEQVLQWTALAGTSIYDKIGLDSSGKLVDYGDDDEDMDDDDD